MNLHESVRARDGGSCGALASASAAARPHCGAREPAIVTSLAVIAGTGRDGSVTGLSVNFSFSSFLFSDTTKADKNVKYLSYGRLMSFLASRKAANRRGRC